MYLIGQGQVPEARGQLFNLRKVGSGGSVIV